MRTQTEIDNEIVALKNALTNSTRWNDATRKMMQAQLRVLTEKMTQEKVDQEYYEDETDPDYRDGDNDLWAECDRTAQWLAGSDDYDPPSAGL
jgi:hypothetical protein